MAVSPCRSLGSMIYRNPPFVSKLLLTISVATVTVGYFVNCSSLWMFEICWADDDIVGYFC